MEETILTCAPAPAHAGGTPACPGGLSHPALPKPTVIYACSGCSDTGELADRAARALSAMKVGEMSCLAGIGGRVRSLVTKAEQAPRLVAIDGCPLNCARRTLELAGFNQVDHVELHRLGFRKGSCPVTSEAIATVVDAASELIRRVAS